jgi:hypothetical protein
LIGVRLILARRLACGALLPARGGIVRTKSVEPLKRTLTEATRFLVLQLYKEHRYYLQHYCGVSGQKYTPFSWMIQVARTAIID